MTADAQIYVQLLNEDVTVWRPVSAYKIRDGVYRIAEQPYDCELEEWEFIPGDVVECELVDSSDGKIIAAKRKIELHES